LHPRILWYFEQPKSRSRQSQRGGSHPQDQAVNRTHGPTHEVDLHHPVETYLQKEFSNFLPSDFLNLEFFDPYFTTIALETLDQSRVFSKTNGSSDFSSGRSEAFTYVLHIFLLMVGSNTTGDSSYKLPNIR
jgi:hypothetical protein